MDVLTILRAPLENYPPSLNQVALLAKAGLRVGVLELSGDSPVAALHPSVRRWQVHRAWNSKTEPLPSFVRRWANWLKFARAVHSRIQVYCPRVVLAYDILAGVFVKPKAVRHRTVYHFHELPDPEAGEGLGPRLGRARAARFSREADLVVFSDAWRAQCYQQDVRLVKLPTVVMNCPMRMDTVPPSPLGELLAEQGKSGWKTVCYLGSVGWDQGVLEAAASMLWWPAQSLFVLIGPCSADIKQRLHQVAAEVGTADRLLFLGCRPHREALALAAGADIGIALIQPTTRNWLYSAGAINKRFEYMALGLAQITNTGPGVADIVEKGGCGRCVDARSPEDIGRDVCALLNSHTVRQDMARNSRSLHLDQFHYERQFEPVLGWIKTAVADSTRRE